MEETGNAALMDKIKEVRKSKRQDWRTYAHDLVAEELDIRDKWLGIKYLKK